MLCIVLQTLMNVQRELLIVITFAIIQLVASSAIVQGLGIDYKEMDPLA